MRKTFQQFTENYPLYENIWKRIFCWSPWCKLATACRLRRLLPHAAVSLSICQTHAVAKHLSIDVNTWRYLGLSTAMVVPNNHPIVTISNRKPSVTWGTPFMGNTIYSLCNWYLFMPMYINQDLPAHIRRYPYPISAIHSYPCPIFFRSSGEDPEKYGLVNRNFNLVVGRPAKSRTTRGFNGFEIKDAIVTGG